MIPDADVPVYKTTWTLLLTASDREAMMNTESTNGTPNPKPKKSGKKSIKNILKQAAYEAENQEFIRIRGHLKEKLSPMRYEHTLGVSFTCISLAMRYGYDLNKAELAGLLHDCAKRYDESEIIKKCRNKGLSDRKELNAPATIHAKLGAWMAENKYGITDPEILQAIACHTTGKPAHGTSGQDFVCCRLYRTEKKQGASAH